MPCQIRRLPAASRIMQTEPYDIDSEPAPSDAEQDDMSRYIQESETEIERDLESRNPYIASGSYSH